MKSMKKLISLVIASIMAITLASCSNSHYTSDGGEITTALITSTTPAETISGTAEVTESLPTEITSSILDREGNEIQIPAAINTIISTAPSVTEILVGLGIGNKIMSADVYSADVAGIDSAICTLDFYNLNIEELIALNPDVIIINGISMTGDSDPYQSLKEAGINVIYIPTSTSISSIKLDIEFLAAYTGTEAKGAELNADINIAVTDIAEKASKITEKKKVYFEIGAAPYLYTCGKDTFLDEVIKLIGAENIYENENGWISNSDESVITANPDVIITNVAYDGYDFNEIKARAGWAEINAVKNGAVYQVDANSTSRGSQNIVRGLYEIAKAVYPDIYAE